MDRQAAQVSPADVQGHFECAARICNGPQCSACMATNSAALISPQSALHRTHLLSSGLNLGLLRRLARLGSLRILPKSSKPASIDLEGCAS